jgi:asparagine synthetase B (glutamine-hydrolysing)
MCAIVGSFKKETIRELFALNAYRGQLSYSLCGMSKDIQLIGLQRGEGQLPIGFIDEFIQSEYYIGHSQAPTTDTKNIHPAQIGQDMLWHNGIVKQKNISSGVWDTEWILQGINTKGFDFLSDVDGSFACILYKNNVLYVFRNEISPLFVDDNLNISSTKFQESRSLEANTVYKIDLEKLQLIPIATFKTKVNPFFFLGE